MNDVEARIHKLMDSVIGDMESMVARCNKSLSFLPSRDIKNYAKTLFMLSKANVNLGKAKLNIAPNIKE